VNWWVIWGGRQPALSLAGAFEQERTWQRTLTAIAALAATSWTRTRPCALLGHPLMFFDEDFTMPVELTSDVDPEAGCRYQTYNGSSLTDACVLQVDFFAYSGSMLARICRRVS
jgi:hypothetical protein